jgi:hypothetical protein
MTFYSNNMALISLEIACLCCYIRHRHLRSDITLIQSPISLPQTAWKLILKCAGQQVVPLSTVRCLTVQAVISLIEMTL